MRKITQQAIDAFMNYQTFNSGNTTVKIDPVIDGVESELYLHGNLIAKRFYSGEIQITSAGWPTNATKERLNGIPGVRINQKNGEWYLNGEKWNGEWIKI